jgi:CBS domain-containing protein
MTDFDDVDRAMVEGELQEIRGALLNDRIAVLGPAEPVCLRESATVQEAIERMLARRQAGVLVVDADGRLIGIFTERDVLTRVMGAGRVARDTLLRDVMTPDPESLRPDDRICYAINRMHAGGFRSLPLVDEAHRPIGIITVNDVVRWLAEIFPEAVLNLRPGDRLKNPAQIDAG